MIRALIIFSVLLLASCSQNSSTLSREDELKLKQYKVKGKALYLLHCSNCHGPEGNGLARMYPPLRNSDWVINYAEKIPCVITRGISSTLVVNGIEFTGEMPPHEDLTNLEIAEITAYLLSDLNESTEFFDVNETIRLLNTCED